MRPAAKVTRHPIVLGVGGFEVLHGRMSVGTFTAFTLYIAMAVAPIQQAGQIVSILSIDTPA